MLIHTSLLITATVTIFIFNFIVQGQAQCDVSLQADASVKYTISPGYPNNYPNNLDCQWHITTSSSKVILLTVLTFNIEGDSLCRYDYVAVYDGNSAYSPRLKLLCGQVFYTQITSSSPYMTIVFHSDPSDSNTGFKFEYSSIENTDMWLSATDTVKYLTSPGYPSNYPENFDFQWHITSYLHTSGVVLKLVDFYTESVLPSCTRDYVTIYDGNSTSSPQLKKWCGQVSTTTVISSGSSLTVKFHSDNSVNYRGFKFEYSSPNNNSAQCRDGSLQADATVKYITSPGYPNNYPNNVDCQWHISTSSSKVIVLTVLNFNTEGNPSSCSYDYVAVYDGINNSSTRIQLLCGQVSYTQITSSGPYMTIVFHSDLSNSNTGFRLQYTSIACSDINLSATATANYLTSPGYPNNYPNNFDRQWYITSKLSSSVVILRLVDFYTEGSSCNNDYVTIYDGSSSYSRQLTKLCGQVSNITIISTGSFMTVKFHSDSSVNYRGFKFEYLYQSKSVQCGDVNLWANETAKYIISPDYPNNYPNNIDCEWRITASSSKVITLEMLNFNTEGSILCSYDYVAVYDGPSTMSKQIAKLCGDLHDRTIDSTGSDMTVVFHSDGTNSYSGFSFAYSSYPSKDISTGLSGGAVAAIVISCIAVPVIIVVIVICAKRMSAKNGARNTQNIVAGPNSGRVVTGRDNRMFFVSQPNMNPTVPYATSVGIVNSHGALNLSPYPNLNININSGLPPYIYSGPGYNINSPPVHCSNVLPDGMTYLEQKSGDFEGYENVNLTTDTPITKSRATEA